MFDYRTDQTTIKQLGVIEFEWFFVHFCLIYHSVINIVFLCVLVFITGDRRKCVCRKNCFEGKRNCVERRSCLGSSNRSSRGIERSGFRFKSCLIMLELGKCWCLPCTTRPCYVNSWDTLEWEIVSLFDCKLFACVWNALYISITSWKYKA